MQLIPLACSCQGAGDSVGETDVPSLSVLRDTQPTASPPKASGPMIEGRTAHRDDGGGGGDETGEIGPGVAREDRVGQIAQIQKLEGPVA